MSKFTPKQMGRSLWVLRNEKNQSAQGATIFKTRKEANTWLTANPNAKPRLSRTKSPTYMEKIMHAALKACMDAMDMQVKRERGELHINQPTAKALWDEAMDKAKIALTLTKGYT